MISHHGGNAEPLIHYSATFPIRAPLCGGPGRQATAEWRYVTCWACLERGPAVARERLADLQAGHRKATR